MERSLVLLGLAGLWASSYGGSRPRGRSCIPRGAADYVGDDAHNDIIHRHGSALSPAAQQFHQLLMERWASV